MHNILSFLSLNFYLYYIFILENFFSCINLLTTILMSLDCFAAVFACVSVPLSERPSVCLCACSDVSFVPLFQPVNGSTSTMESYESLPQSEDQVKLLQTKNTKIRQFKTNSHQSVLSALWIQSETIPLYSAYQF